MQFTHEGYAEAGAIWSKGLAEFPNSSLLRIKLGFAHSSLTLYSDDEKWEEHVQRAGELVREALAMQGLTPMEKKLAHWLFAYVLSLEGDLEGAVQQAELGIALSPYDAFLIGDCSQFPIWVGHYDKAIAWADFAIKNDPALTFYYLLYKGWAQTAAERYVDSRKTLKQAGDFFLSAPLLRAINAVRLDLPEEAKAEIGKALEIRSGFTAEQWRSKDSPATPPSSSAKSPTWSRLVCRRNRQRPRVCCEAIGRPLIDLTAVCATNMIVTVAGAIVAMSASGAKRTSAAGSRCRLLTPSGHSPGSSSFAAFCRRVWARAPERA